LAKILGWKVVVDRKRFRWWHGVKLRSRNISGWGADAEGGLADAGADADHGSASAPENGGL
jgi:hypothetical protein